MEPHLNRSAPRSKLAARRGRLAALHRGLRAESLAAWWLRLKGYRILAQGYRGGSGAGEIDLVVRKRDMLAFVEVKARASLADAAEALRPAQRQRIARGAESFLRRHPQFATFSLRFDAMLLAPGHWPRHIIDAWRDGM